MTDLAMLERFVEWSEAMELKPDTYYAALLHTEADRGTLTTVFRGDTKKPANWPGNREWDTIAMMLFACKLDWGTPIPPGTIEIFELAEPVERLIGTLPEESP